MAAASATPAAPAADRRTPDAAELKSERIPTLEDVKLVETGKEFAFVEEKCRLAADVSPPYRMKPNYVLYNHFGYKEDLTRRIALKREYSFYNYCFVSVCLSFILGLVIGVVIVGAPPGAGPAPRRTVRFNSTRDIRSRSLNSLKFSSNFKTNNEFHVADGEKDTFATVSFTGAVASHKYKDDVYPKTLTEDMKEILKDNKDRHHTPSISGVLNKTAHVPNDLTVLYDNIFWGPEVENSMPQGYGENSAELWEKYVDQSEVVKMELGCGRMQNRLVTFKDGIQACVRYRQNTDQIQGEIFSFYVARLLNLTNLAPSVVKVVDLKDKLWAAVASDVAAAQWNTNRAVVFTQYIPSLESATIPDIFKPSTRHLNKHDVLKMSQRENDTIETSKRILIDKLKLKNVKTVNENAKEIFDHVDAKLSQKMISSLVELAQWSDLIVFDFLTANLDRIVNNLFNYQWNANIMDGPAHNLARRLDSGLLLFLDNESGLLHGYRLLRKYSAYHSLLLDGLCVFRRRTVLALRALHAQPLARTLTDIFHRKNNAVIRDILPPLPEKNAKILHERIGKVLSQVDKCQQTFANKS